MNKAALELRKILRELKDMEAFQAATQKYIKDTFALYYHVRKIPLAIEYQQFPMLFKYRAPDGTPYCILDNDFKNMDFEAEMYHKNLKIIATQSDLLDKTTANIQGLKKKALAICQVITEEDLEEAKSYEEHQKHDLNFQYKQLMLKKNSMQDVLYRKYELIYHTHTQDTITNYAAHDIIYTQTIDNLKIYFIKNDYLPKSTGFIEFTQSLIANEQHILDTLNQKLILLDGLIKQGHQFIK